MRLRWASGYSARGSDEVAALWRDRQIGRALVIVGAGFDPRTAVAYEVISQAAQVPVDILRCELPMPTLPETSDLARANRTRVEAAAAKAGANIIDHDPVQMSGMSIARSILAAHGIVDYDEIVVDVSAMPRAVYFPLIRGLIELSDSNKAARQLHVVATDNPRVDQLVVGEGAEAPRALPGFADIEEDNAATRIWVPVLGEGEAARLEILYEDLRAAEICPVLPFPAANPRRADDLLKEYRTWLIETERVELRNIIYAHESNPYDLYATVSKLNADYREALKPLVGDTKMVLSAHASKLLSVGVLLTAFEQRLEVRHASPSRYGIRDVAALPGLEQHDFVVDLWLTGDPYG
ncbi:hypothetical protein [Baekduia sp.]|jgi:hypothetical protein|uniref:hypothetical protein n=1 Tax=Baekduia sp. TaxID=2600305 RepID=UPI002DFD4AA0|nr:hypothetical protein [Baekduia sp.]